MLRRIFLVAVLIFSRVPARAAPSADSGFGDGARGERPRAAPSADSGFGDGARGERPRAAVYEHSDELYFRRHLGENLAVCIRDLEALRRASPDDAEVLWRLGRALVRQGEREADKKEKLALFDRAEEILERAVELDDKNPSAHFWLGLALGRKGESRGVMKSLFLIGPLKKRMRRVLELDPKHGGAHHVLGRMYFRLPGFAGGSNKKAAAELEEALRLSPDFTAHYPALAEVYAAEGRNEDAVRVLKAFFEVKSPSDPPVYEEHSSEVRRLLSELEPSGRGHPAP